jgi:hypothetical protein
VAFDDDAFEGELLAAGEDVVEVAAGVAGHDGECVVGERGELLEELPAFPLRDVEEARPVQLEQLEGDEADRTFTAAGGHRAGKFVELCRASGSGD